MLSYPSMCESSLSRPILSDTSWDLDFLHSNHEGLDEIWDQQLPTVFNCKPYQRGDVVSYRASGINPVSPTGSDGKDRPPKKARTDSEDLRLSSSSDAAGTKPSHWRFLMQNNYLSLRNQTVFCT
ncbi:hypothetical protein Bca4012_056514 [Brassica carinata]